MSPRAAATPAADATPVRAGELDATLAPNALDTPLVDDTTSDAETLSKSPWPFRQCSKSLLDRSVIFEVAA